ncbi:MAG: MBL fold metallo-hydrolase [Gammaproteobacteria bacterium]|nr:MBL fold metallo-hydrolase [Gammaproteobacteria bacterium]MDH4313641.1 MBL fold metallo-hydrolase [Gammaproteobacteria bacterium]MDH5213854.1 MBL fold metallo-hydrolase [Gammaproteobacteria bacterium]MDH5500375.1 MBL fold metallo-hydrolase [Gammaproteobacteria bacterium]
MSSELRAGILQEVATGVRRLVAPNPGMMTGPGTNTYLLGRDAIAVIDPGPRIDAHIDAIAEGAGAPVRWILATHTHPDHSPAVSALAAMTGAEVLGRPAPEGRHQDRTFHPDRILDDADVLKTAEFELQAVHTPGHASNHVCYLLRKHRCLFTGDHIINGSTVVIDPPDGNMQQYIESLRRLKDIDIASIAPGHGEVFTNPYEVIDWIIDHRLEREGKVIAALRKNPASTSMELVAVVYKDVDRALYPVAERSLLAHLIKLKDEGRAVNDQGRWRQG